MSPQQRLRLPRDSEPNWFRRDQCGSLCLVISEDKNSRLSQEDIDYFAAHGRDGMIVKMALGKQAKHRQMWT